MMNSAERGVHAERQSCEDIAIFVGHYFVRNFNLKNLHSCHSCSHHPKNLEKQGRK